MIRTIKKTDLDNSFKGLIAGCFDIIHPGYIRMFQDAKTVCDHLIIALQSDPTIDRPESKNPPIYSVQERLLIISSIKHVDEVVQYSTEKDLYDLLKTLKEKKRIDVRILGSDYMHKTFTGDDLEIPVYFHDRDHDWSVSRVRQSILETTKI